MKTLRDIQNVYQEGIIDKMILDNTMVGLESLESIVQLSTVVNDLSGCIAEVGVYNGGSSLLLCKLNPEKEILIFDTFEGMPETNSFDNEHKKGDFNDVSEQYLRNLLKDYLNCSIYKGVFPRDTGIYAKNKLFKLVHLDVDIYESYKNCLEFFYPRMVRNGVVIMDDYGSEFCLGAKKAIDEFMSEKPEKLIIGPQRQSHFIKE